MTRKEVKEMLESTGIPFAFYIWRKPPPLPWGTFRIVDENVFYADGVAYYGSDAYQVELYTRKKDEAQEQKVEDALDTEGISYAKNEMRIEDEDMYMVRYEIEV